MKYMLLIYSEPGGVGGADGGRAGLARSRARAGEWVGGSVLAPPAQSKAVRARSGEVQVVDGPFAEAKEHLAGSDIVECESTERAAQIAARIPDARLARVEVRPMVEPAA